MIWASTESAPTITDLQFSEGKAGDRQLLPAFFISEGLGRSLERASIPPAAALEGKAGTGAPGSLDRCVRRMAAIAGVAFAQWLCSSPAFATFQDGVDLWQRGDYPGAVAEWMPEAAKGDLDALYNIGLAYRMGRGVEQDRQRAEEFFRKAASAGHTPAKTALGIMAIRLGRKQEAMLWLGQSAGEGDARAQYLLGIAYYQGDAVKRDVPLAYALISRAADAGVPQAAVARAKLEATLTSDDLARGRSIATKLDGNHSVMEARLAADLPAGAGLSAEGNNSATSAVPANPAAADNRTSAITQTGQKQDTQAAGITSPSASAVVQGQQAAQPAPQ